jgi:hypothetical protein
MSTTSEGFIESYSWGDRFHSYEGEYRGATIDGPRRIPNGRGTFTGTGEHDGGPSTTMTYAGEWVNGQREGKGRCTEAWKSPGPGHPAGSTVYEGDFARDAYHGPGKMTGQGFVMEGEWADGLLKRGALRLDDGRWFEGDWAHRYSAQYPTKGVLGAADGSRSEVEFSGTAFLAVDGRAWPAPSTSSPL